MFNIRKIAAAMAGIAVITGTTALIENTAVSFVPAESVASAAFVPRSFKPKQLFICTPKEFVEKFNSLGQSNSESRLHAPEGQKEIINDAESTFTNVHFDTNGVGTEIYAMTISGYEPDDVKTALLRTIYMIDRRYVTEAAQAFEKIVVDKTSDEEGIANERLIITKAEGKNAIKFYILWGNY